MDALVDRYRRERSLGQGAMGEVWLAEDTLLGRPVAIKQLRTDPGATLSQWAERMLREARLAAQLNHPNAVAIYDLIIVDERPYVVMEYVPGDSLARRIRQAGHLAPEQAGRWIGQVAAALEAAHARGIVHRDVKPANILITADDSAKLADFGIARSVQDVSQTQSDAMIGTPAFLAPEVARGGEPSPASDVWSLGATLYAAVEGRPPFGSGDDNPLAVLSRICSEPVPPPTSAGLLGPILAAMLHRDPARRPTAAQVRSGLTSEAPAPGQHIGPVLAEPVPAGPVLAQPDPGDVEQTQLRWHPAHPPGPVATSGPFSASPSGWLAAGVLIAVLVVAGGVIAAVAVSSPKSTAHNHPTGSTPPSTSSSPDFPSTSSQPSTSPAAPTTRVTTSKPRPTTYPEPVNVPALPAAGQAVPVNATPPGPPANPVVRPYTSPDPTPTTGGQIIEWRPPALSGDEAAAVASITKFLTDINRQDLADAWNTSTEIQHGPTPDATFTKGYRTSRHYQVAFGPPRRLDADLIAVPARFVSRQDPAAQGNPPGVTGCTYWPQFVFLAARVNGRWLDDVAGDYVNRASVTPLKRTDTVRGGLQLLPLQQRVAC